MSGSVSLVALQLGLFLALSALCGLLFFVLKRENALAWLGCALVLGVVEMLLFATWPSDAVDQLAGIVCVPFSLYCVARCLAILNDAPDRGSSLPWHVSIALGAVAAVAVALDLHFYVVMTLFQLSITAALASPARMLIRRPDATALDRLLLAAFGVLALVYLSRVPLWAAFTPAGATYSEVRHSAVDTAVLTVGGLTSMAVSLLLMVRAVEVLIGHMRRRSERDGLSGLLNREAFLAAASVEMRRTGAIVYCDIDHFKRINDRYGHGVGDEVIRRMARLLEGSGYRVGRLGGEEFGLLMPSTSSIRAYETADELRAAFRKLDIAGIDPTDRPTASFGIAMYQRGDRPIAYLDRADQALYLAKNNGRDQVALLNPVNLDVRGPIRAAVG